MIRVLLADDHKIVREGFRAILARARDIEIVAEARDGQAAIRLAQELAPDVVLMDIAMPGCNGIEAARPQSASSSSVRPEVSGPKTRTAVVSSGSRAISAAASRMSRGRPSIARRVRPTT